MRRGLLLAVALAGVAEATCFTHPSAPPMRAGVRGICSMAGQEFKGFGKEQPKKAESGAPPKVPVGSSEAPLSREDIEKMMGDRSQAAMPAIDPMQQGGERKVVNRKARADPVNLDGGAMLDIGWVKQSVDTVFSDDWKKAGKEERKTGEGVCAECGGTGRIQGGLGTLPGLDWWPIKAFRPCPTCEAAGRSYTRRGQVLDEVLFGNSDMPIDYEAKPDGRGLSAEDVKKIMKKREKKPPSV